MFIFEKMIKINDNLHSRTAGNFVFAISKLKSDIFFEKDDRSINAKSILGILSLSLRQYDTINVKVVNNNSAETAKEDLEKVVQIISDKTGVA